MSGSYNLTQIFEDGKFGVNLLDCAHRENKGCSCFVMGSALKIEGNNVT